MSDQDHGPREARLSRRLFLLLLAGAGAGTVAEACSRGVTARVTPTPTRTPRGVAKVDPSSTPTATATGAPSPSATATPGAPGGFSPLSPEATPEATGTATKRPTKTPRPSPTPFPPGPPTKLGLFVGRNDPRIRDMLRTGNVTLVKTLEYDAGFAEEIKSLAPKVILVGRIDLPQINLAEMNDPAGAARAFADKLLTVAAEPRRQATFDAWEAYNEPVAENPEHMGRLAAFEAERTRILAEAGIRSVIGNFSTGAPPLELWPQFQPAIEAAIKYKGYLGLHEYSAPTMQWNTTQELLKWGVEPSDDGWLTLRYRKIYRQFMQPNKLNLPLLITELGIDGAVGGHPGPQGKGWLDFTEYWEKELHMGPGGAGNYMQQLAWYDGHMQQDDYVLGSAIFAAPSPPDWESFEILNEVEPILRQYMSVHPAA